MLKDKFNTEEPLNIYKIFIASLLLSTTILPLTKKQLIARFRSRKKVSLFAKANKNVKVYARKRASADVEAASARGLRADRYSNRTKTFPTMVVEEQLKHIENVVISEEELINFILSIYEGD